MFVLPHMQSIWAMQMSLLQIEWWCGVPPGACKCHTKACKFSRDKFSLKGIKTSDSLCVFIPICILSSPSSGLYRLYQVQFLELYLVILVLNSKAFPQVPKHLWTVVFEFELSWKILSEKKAHFNSENVCSLASCWEQNSFNQELVYYSKN